MLHLTASADTETLCEARLLAVKFRKCIEHALSGWFGPILYCVSRNSYQGAICALHDCALSFCDGAFFRIQFNAIHR